MKRERSVSPSGRHTLLFLTQAGIIAAMYAALCLVFEPISYGPVQVRVAEVLTILPVFDFVAVPGLAVGCLIANLIGGQPWDWLFGTAATLLAALLTYGLRSIRVKGLPLLSTVPPVLLNAVIVGAELALFDPDGFSLPLFFLIGAEVGAGQLVACVIGGLLLFLALRHHASRIFRR